MEDDDAPIFTRFRRERLPSGRHMLYAEATIGDTEHKLQIECQNLAFGERRIEEQVAELAVAHERAKLGEIDAFDDEVTKADRRARRGTDNG